VTAVADGPASSRRYCQTTVMAAAMTVPCLSARRRRRHVAALCRRARPTRTYAARRPSTVSDRNPPSASVSSPATSARPATGTAFCATCRWKPAADTVSCSRIHLRCRLVIYLRDVIYRAHTQLPMPGYLSHYSVYIVFFLR